MVGEEAFKIYREVAILILLKAYRLYEALGLFIGHSPEKACVMYAAQIYEIESSASENEPSLKIKAVGNGGEIVYETALVGELELRHAGENVIDCCGVRTQIGIIFYVAGKAYLFLLFFCLNG